MAEKVFQQAQLGDREGDLPARPDDPRTCDVHRQVADLEGVAARTGGAQQGLDTRHELGQCERLDEVVVGPPRNPRTRRTGHRVP
jgi:hypothetical protein